MELKKGLWSREEDLILINHIQRHGHPNWRAVPQQAGLMRCGKSCRLRWVNYLRPNIKRGNFTREEEETIIRLHGIRGNKWSAIAKELPGRTDNEIKNVWHSYLKKRLPQPTELKQSQNREQSADQIMESQKFDNQEPTQKEQQQQQQPVMNFNFPTHHDHVTKVESANEMSSPLPMSSKPGSSRDMSTLTISDSNNEKNNNLIVANNNNNNVNKDHDMLMNNSPEPQDDDFWSEILSGDDGAADLNFKSPFSPISSFHNMDFWQTFK